jgi:hypothetical protein
MFSLANDAKRLGYPHLDDYAMEVLTDPKQIEMYAKYSHSHSPWVLAVPSTIRGNIEKGMVNQSMQGEWLKLAEQLEKDSIPVLRKMIENPGLYKVVDRVSDLHYYLKGLEEGRTSNSIEHTLFTTRKKILD